MKQNKSLKAYFLLWSTQTLSLLGSGMTNYALVLWLYINSGSALKTALLSVCSYAPYVLVSIFAGTLCDKLNKKKTMLVCDLIAALSTVTVLILVVTNRLEARHLYILNALNGLMNTVSQPAGEVAATILVPEEYYQKTSGLRSFSSSLNSILTPVIATTLFSFAGIKAVIAVDLISFFIAFVTLGIFIDIPEPPMNTDENESMLSAARSGLSWLKNNGLVLSLIIFLSCINLTASAYDAALPALILSKKSGGKAVLGAVNTCVGAASLIGSIVTAIIPAPKNRIRAIVVSIFISMGTENFLLAFSDSPFMWCVGAILGWITIPFMNANLDVIFRCTIPPEMQGRVFSCRNTLQFFTIPVGSLLGGLLVDKVFEPFMAARSEQSILTQFFGSEKGAGAALLFFIIGIISVLICVVFGVIMKKNKLVYRENCSE